MSKQPSTIIDELIGAARGLAGIVTGDRGAAVHFDFSQRGLVGSFIALLVATTINAFLPAAAGDSGGDGMSPAQLVFIAGFLYAVQLGFAALVLRQLRRLDGFVPYIVADNWATFFLTVLLSLLSLMGVGGDLVIIVFGILVLIVEINTARLIVTLSPWQIAMFLVAQLVGVAVGLILMSPFVSLPAESLPTP